MIVFKITNNFTQKNYIGTSFGNMDRRFEQYISAAKEGLDFPLYEEIRRYGPDNFSLEELFETSDKEELYELEQDYLTIYNGESLRGYKISQTVQKPESNIITRKAKFDSKGMSQTKTTSRTSKKALTN